MKFKDLLPGMQDKVVLGGLVQELALKSMESFIQDMEWKLICLESKLRKVKN